MAGLSSRFAKAGFTLPKYMLYIKNKSLFYLAVSSFKKYFNNSNFIFIARDLFDTQNFISNECNLLGIQKYKIVILNSPTKGQAETVYQGITKLNLDTNDSILIFNIDTFRPNFSLPPIINNCDGYLECFIGNGANWSYAKTKDGSINTQVIETAEKKEISNFCSTGIYYFKKISDFIHAYNSNENEVAIINGVKELYVAPLYNFLIKENKKILINIIKKEEVIFCGVPEEYITLLKQSL